MNQDYQKLENLIHEFKKLPRTKRNDETFISICRFPHQEKVFSNILAFFFDTEREHNLKDLFVESLIEAAGLNPDDFLENFSSETEVYTKKGNYIDLLLRSDEKNIVIENKIYAELHNDLDDYYESAQEEGKENPLGIVLSLYKQSDELVESNPKYKFVVYEDFLNQIKENIGFYKKNANQKYISFLSDFIETIETLARGKSMDTGFVRFLKDNEEAVLEFSKKFAEFRKELRNTVNKVNSLILADERLREKIADKKLKVWPWHDSSGIFDVAVVDYFPDDKNQIDIALDSTINLDGWNFALWRRKDDTGKVMLKDYIEKIGEKGEIKHFKFVLDKTFAFDANPEKVAGFIVDLICKM